MTCLSTSFQCPNSSARRQMYVVDLLFLFVGEYCPRAPALFVQLGCSSVFQLIDETRRRRGMRSTQLPVQFTAITRSTQNRFPPSFASFHCTFKSDDFAYIKLAFVSFLLTQLEKSKNFDDNCKSLNVVSPRLASYEDNERRVSPS